MAVKIYKGGKFRPMSGANMYHGNSWNLLSDNNKFRINNKWYSIGGMETILTTPHDLTSNTDSPEFTLSMSSVHEGCDAWRAMDGSAGEGYEAHSSKEDNPYWQIAFAKACQITDFTFTFRDRGDFGYTDFTFSGSEDGQNWDLLNSFTIKMEKYYETIVEVNNQQPYRYYRITANGTNNYLIICELEFRYYY